MGSIYFETPCTTMGAGCVYVCVWWGERGGLLLVYILLFPSFYHVSYATLCYAILRYAMLLCVTLCYAMLCYAVLKG